LSHFNPFKLFIIITNVGDSKPRGRITEIQRYYNSLPRREGDTDCSEMITVEWDPEVRKEQEGKKRLFHNC
jgi:hypothetical protein